MDSQALADLLDPDAAPLLAVPRTPLSPHEVQWQPPVPEFALSRVVVSNIRVTLSREPSDPVGPEVLLCLNGEVTVSSDGRDVRLRGGQSAFLSASASPAVLAGKGQVYRATVGRALPASPQRHSSEPERGVSVERDTFPGLIEAGELVMGYHESAYWLDVGTPQTFVRGSCDLVLGRLAASAVPGPPGDMLLLAGASVEPDASVSGGSVVGVGASVGSGATVYGSVLFNSATVGEGAVVRGSIVGRGAVVAPGAVLDDAVVETARMSGRATN